MCGLLPDHEWQNFISLAQSISRFCQVKLTCKPRARKTSIFSSVDSNFDLDKSFGITSFGTGTLHLQMSKLWMIIVDMLVEAEQVSVHFRTRWTVNGFSFHVMDSYMSFDIGYEFWEVTTNATRPKSASGINCFLHEIQHTWNDWKSKICIFKTSSKWTNKIFVKYLCNLSKK